MEGCAALLDKRRASGAATFLSDRDRAGPSSEQSSSCSRERESKVGAESREEFLGRRRGRGRLSPGSRRSLPGGAPHCRLLEAPGPPTTTSPSPIRATSSLWPLQQRQIEMTTIKSKTWFRTSKFAGLGVTQDWRLKTWSQAHYLTDDAFSTGVLPLISFLVVFLGTTPKLPSIWQYKWNRKSNSLGWRQHWRRLI